MKAGILTVCVCMCVSVGAVAAPRYSIRGIESPDPAYRTWGYSINDRGEVVGVLDADNRADLAFLWNGSGSAEGLPPPATSAHAINNRGEELGFAEGGDFVRSADGSRRAVAAAAGWSWAAAEDGT